jgi:hypothetical protein
MIAAFRIAVHDNKMQIFSHAMCYWTSNSYSCHNNLIMVDDLGNTIQQSGFWMALNSSLNNIHTTCVNIIPLLGMLGWIQDTSNNLLWIAVVTVTPEKLQLDYSHRRCTAGCLRTTGLVVYLMSTSQNTLRIRKVHGAGCLEKVVVAQKPKTSLAWWSLKVRR